MVGQEHIVTVYLQLAYSKKLVTEVGGVRTWRILNFRLRSLNSHLQYIGRYG